jgi:hypothetical protein
VASTRQRAAWFPTGVAGLVIRLGWQRHGQLCNKLLQAKSIVNEAFEEAVKGKRRLGHIGFAIDASRFPRSVGEHHLQQRLQYLLQNFAAVWAMVSG